MLGLLREGLRPFVEREYRARYGANWRVEAAQALGHAEDWGGNVEDTHLDVQALLILMWVRWNEVFQSVLGHVERSYVSELREVRNRWAHQNAFTIDDTTRALDTAARLLTAISAPEAQEVERGKQELLRLRFEEQARREARQSAGVTLEGQPRAGLRPWREVVMPHPDVASGRYQQAEFAADLGQVHRGEGTSEYSDPREFYQRTFITEGLHRLLLGAVRRLAGTNGDPVIELQTNFGGGKTHSMLALYHLFSGVSASELVGVEPILKEAGVAQPPATRRAVLDGTALSPGQPHRHPDGVEVYTLWGELAWQIGGQDGYSLVAEADRRGVSPGSDVLRDLFSYFTPCLVLIDEWVAFVRQLYGVSGLPAGSFDANLTFAQALTEAARQAPNTLVVASIPSSDIEIGGEGGHAALERLKNTFGRLESAWRPASAEEGFEIVRRRLFQPITDPQLFAARDAVVQAFSELYQSQHGEFPPECREAAYARRLKESYPVHPELFDRLYEDWSSLDKFQRTRGVLRLMAAVIHTLWEHLDSGLLLLPASVPIGEPAVQFELTRYLEDPWVPVIEKDVDGPSSLPLEIDRQNPNLGRYSACRRVARTLYLGSAPTLHTNHRGLEDRSVKLGCAQPGESAAVFGDALRRLTDQATHLYVDGHRYWYSTQPSVTRLAQDRAAQQDPEAVAEEIRRRLRSEQSMRGDFARVHICPASSADVPDDREARLVVLGPECPHVAKATESIARQTSAAILDQRGSGPRIYRNALVFLAPDKTRLAELDQAVRLYLAWRSIDDERESLNLDAFQSNQARAKCRDAEDTVKQRIPETYCWTLVPVQPDPQGNLDWQEVRLQGQDPLAVRASKRLRNEHLYTQFAPTLLRLELDRVPLWRGDHVSVKQLWDDFAQYLYLPRLKDGDLLLQCIREGAAMLTWESETFAYAEAWDEQRGRYLGLRAGSTGSVIADGSSLVVKPEAARRQLEADAAQRQSGTGPEYGEPALAGEQVRVANGGVQMAQAGDTTASTTDTVSAPVVLGRFHGSVALDATRIGRDAGRIAEEIVQHLSTLPGARVNIALEIQVEIPDGVPENVVRTVTENCRTLRFNTYGFEER